MENKLSKLKSLKKITLTDEERNLMRAHAARIIMSTPILVTESFFKRGVQHGLRIALSSMLFIVFIAGSVSAVANNALPGDPFLYPIKKDINERLLAVIVGTSPATKASYSAALVTTRFNEIQTLAKTNTLTPATQEIAAQAITSQVADLSANINTLSDQSPSSALAVTTSLEQTLKANKTTLENTPTTSTAQADGKAAALNTVDTTIQTVSNQEVQILSKEIDNINAAVTTVPTSASAAITTSNAATQTPATPDLKVTPDAP
jgi:hypothetical protein